MRRDEWLFTDVASLNTWSTTSAILLCECVINSNHSPQYIIHNTVSSRQAFILLKILFNNFFVGHQVLCVGPLISRLFGLLMTSAMGSQSLCGSYCIYMYVFHYLYAVNSSDFPQSACNTCLPLVILRHYLRLAITIIRKAYLKPNKNNRYCCKIFKGHYRSGTVNSNKVNSKFHLIRSYCEIFVYHFPNISCLKCTVNSNFHLIWSKTLPMNDFELTVPNLQTAVSRNQNWTSTTLVKWNPRVFLNQL